VLADVAADGVLDIGDGFEDTASDLSAGDGREEPFEDVEPGCGGGSDMEHPARVIGELLGDLGMLVDGVVVGDGVDDLAGPDSALDGGEEVGELLGCGSACNGRPRYRRGC
jgi:hypothetical protein